MILLVSIPSIKSHREDPRRILAVDRFCSECHRLLTKHDSRLRWVYELVERFQIVIFRLRCRACSVTVTLLPDQLVPYFRYLSAIIEKTVGDYVTTAQSVRIVAVELSQPILPPDQSLTDALLSISLKPSYQRIFAWAERMGSTSKQTFMALGAWLTRLRPESLFVPLLSTPVFDKTAIRALSKQGSLRTSSLLILVMGRHSDLGAGRGWIRSHNRFVLQQMGLIPWRQPPPLK